MSPDEGIMPLPTEIHALEQLRRDGVGPGISFTDFSNDQLTAACYKVQRVRSLDRAVGYEQFLSAICLYAESTAK